MANQSFSNPSYNFNNDFGNDKSRIEKWETADLYVNLVSGWMCSKIESVIMGRQKRSLVTLDAGRSTPYNLWGVEKSLGLRVRTIPTPDSNKPFVDQADLLFGYQTPVSDWPECGNTEWNTLVRNRYPHLFIDVSTPKGSVLPIVILTDPRGLIASGTKNPKPKSLHFRDGEWFWYFNAMNALRSPVRSVLVIIYGKDMYIRKDFLLDLWKIHGLNVPGIKNFNVHEISLAEQEEMNFQEIAQGFSQDHIEKSVDEEISEASNVHDDLTVGTSNKDLKLTTIGRYGISAYYLGPDINHGMEQGSDDKMQLRPDMKRSSTEYYDDEELLFHAEAAKFLGVKSPSIYGIDLVRHPYMTPEDVFIPALYRSMPMWRKKNLRRYIVERRSNGKKDGLTKVNAWLTDEEIARIAELGIKVK